jgi:rhamnulokinase
MADEVRGAAGLGPDATQAVVARSIVESVAAAVARVLDELRRQSIPVDEVAVVGGGAGSSFVLERIAHHARVPVVSGATEATALGNALLQGIALGRFADLAEGRRWLRAGSADPASG